MKRMKQVLALLLSLALLLGLSGLAEEPVEAAEIAEPIEELIEEAPAEEAEAPAEEELPEEEELVEEPEEEAPAEEELPAEEAPAEEELPAEEAPVDESGEEIFEETIESEPINADSDFVIEDGVLKKYNGSDADVVIPDGVTRIDVYAFASDGPVRSIHIPDSVTTIDAGAFEGCEALEQVQLSSNLTRINNATFADCTRLQTINLPENLTGIGEDAFSGCSSLDPISLPKNLTELGPKAFKDCSSLRSIVIPKGITMIQYSTFEGCTSLSSVELPETMLNIRAHVFGGCSALTSIKIPEHLETLSGFDHCDGLTEVTIPKDVRNLNEAFKYCKNLQKVTFLGNYDGHVPTTLQNNFVDCPNLREVYLPKFCRIVNLPSVIEGDPGDPEFVNCPNLKVYLYEGSEAETYCKENNIPYEYRKDDTEPYIDSFPVADRISQNESITLRVTTVGISKKESYTFSSSDTHIALVSKSGGKITGKNPGTAIITITGKTSKLTARCTVYVISAPTKVSIAKPAKLDYTTDDASFSLAASVEPADAAQSVKWSSSDETVARVSAVGQVTLVGQGKATITAKSEKKGTNGKQRSDSFVLNVEDPHMPANVKIVEKASGPVYVDKDKTLTLHYAMDPVKEGQEPICAVTWSIPKAKERKIATINAETGEITPIKEGSATVKITTQKKGGTGSKKKQLTDTVKITVVDPTKPRSVQINDGEKELPLYYEAGKTLALQATIDPATATQGVKWSIPNKNHRKIATIDAATGVVTPTGKKFGVVTVKVETTAKKSNKKSATATIKIAVVDPKFPYSVKITGEDGAELQDGVELKVGQTLALSASIEPSTATEKTALSWSIPKAQKKYATVDAKTGAVTGVKAGGSVTVTVKTANGKKDTLKIKIVQ